MTFWLPEISNIPSTTDFSDPLRTTSTEARSPRSRLIASIRIDFPAPVFAGNNIQSFTELNLNIFNKSIIFNKKWTEHKTRYNSNFNIANDGISIKYPILFTLIFLFILFKFTDENLFEFLAKYLINREKIDQDWVLFI